MDRRNKPSHGYRAVHVIVEVSGKPIEIQVRSSLQHLWAELSEKCSDVLDSAIKYGGGPDEWQILLTGSSKMVADQEELEKGVVELSMEHEHKRMVECHRNDIVDFLNGMISDLDDLERQKQ